MLPAGFAPGPGWFARLEVGPGGRAVGLELPGAGPSAALGQCRGVSPERGSFPRALPRMRFSSGLCGASFAERIVEARAVPPGVGAHCL